MNKTKSGLSAKLKATLVAPFAIIIFFLFSDFTLKGTETGFILPGAKLSGLWIKKTQDDFSKTLFINGSSFSYSEGIDIRDFHMQLEKDALVLSQRSGAKGSRLRYSISGDELSLWWNDSGSSTYVRSTAGNTLDHFLAQNKLEMDLPHISKYRLMEPEESLCRIGFGKENGGGWAVTFNGQAVELQEVAGLVEREREKVFFLDQKSFTVMFLVDKGVPMLQVDKVRLELRKTGALRIAEGGYPQGDLELSPLIYHAVGLPRMLPPMDALTLDKKELEKRGGNIHTIDLSARNTTPGDVDEALQSFISKSKDGKYVISLEYDGAIPYGQYVEAVDMVFKVVYRFREELSQEKYNASYDGLGDELQRQIRRAYPLALSETMK